MNVRQYEEERQQREQKLIEENNRLREALEEISTLRNHVYPTEYVSRVESLARKALEGDKQ